MDTVVSVKSDKNITEQIKTEITALDEILDCCSETSEISELNRKKEKICSSELTDFILQSEELSRPMGTVLIFPPVSLPDSGVTHLRKKCCLKGIKSQNS